jgi:predicted nucleic acid-binding protein
VKRVFLDTNIAIDLIADRAPFADDADEIFNAGKSGSIHILLSSVSFTNIYYVSRRLNGPVAALKAVAYLHSLVNVAVVDAQCLTNALDAGFADFEDAVQHESAVHSAADIIITRDEQGFKQSRIPVMSPKAFLRTL